MVDGGVGGNLGDIFLLYGVKKKTTLMMLPSNEGRIFVRFYWHQRGTKTVNINFEQREMPSCY